MKQVTRLSAFAHANHQRQACIDNARKCRGGGSMLPPGSFKKIFKKGDI